MSEISTANCVFCILALCSLNVVYGCFTDKKKKKKNHAQYDFCDSSVSSREIVSMFLVGQVSRLVENINIGIFSDTINVMNVKFCMTVLRIELYS